MADEVFFIDGFFGDYPGGLGAKPSAPVITSSVSGTTVTITFDGDAGVTNYLFYKPSGATAWTDGGNRAGDGDIVVAGLSTGVRYTFVGYSFTAAGGNSDPSLTLDVLIQTTTTSVQNGLLSGQADTFLANFGETVTYYPSGGGSRSIVGIVDRNPVSGVNGVPHGNTAKFMISVKNSASEGISSSEVDAGGDKIGFSNRIGRTAIQRRIQDVQWHDTGMLYLEVA